MSDIRLAPRVWTTWHTNGADGRDHAVTDEAMAAADDGIYEGLCGVTVVPGSMTQPPGPQCPACRGMTRRSVEGAGQPVSRPRARRPFARLWRR
ncbi:hypothetical protein EV193_11718 [Herbihabitans rhizosphaerae]|uniref:Uncharacterized protein n=1 Tax=Herbihabitans rhizosphaerae TaxID=1872711 RepID=A0A4V2ERC0_9PSEU|nr:hypothetical protein [Herbihabitans rhizosphaerae]RZS30322.1 hypothetical protein EV193_11718 [Herbihabitans rhizosphaerae]